MNEEERIELYKRALTDWGIRPQTMMVMEETGEMLEAIGKFDRGRANESEVITELVDVWILMEQMGVFFGWDEFKAEKERKLERLRDRSPGHLAESGGDAGHSFRFGVVGADVLLEDHVFKFFSSCLERDFLVFVEEEAGVG